MSFRSTLLRALQHRSMVALHLSTSRVRRAAICDRGDTGGNCTATQPGVPCTGTTDRGTPFQFHKLICMPNPKWLAVPCRCSNGDPHIARPYLLKRPCVEAGSPWWICTLGLVSNKDSRNSQRPGHQPAEPIVQLFSYLNHLTRISCYCSRTPPNGKWTVFHSNKRKGMLLLCWCRSAHCQDLGWFCLELARNSKAAGTHFPTAVAVSPCNTC